MFLAKLFFRPDARASFWKEKFLFGLSRALNEKIQESLREKYNGTIPYDILTYGDLISEVKKEGLKLCFQLRLQNQVKKDLKASRKDLGSFCAQYGIIKKFNEKQIPTKARPIQMNPELLEYCKKEINDLLNKKLIRPSHSPWSCAAFYVQKVSEIERGTPRLVINYKPLNKVYNGFGIQYLIKKT